MAMSFTPDGYLVAAANGNRVLIWNAEAGGVPKASWKGLLGKLTNGSLTNGDGVDENMLEDGLGDPNPSLSWDAEGGKLALGVGNQVYLILICRASFPVVTSRRLRSSIFDLEHSLQYDIFSSEMHACASHRCLDRPRPDRHHTQVGSFAELRHS